MFNASEQIHLLDIAEMLPLYIKEQTATGGTENAGLENAGPNFQGGKRTTTIYGTLNG